MAVSSQSKATTTSNSVPGAPNRISFAKLREPLEVPGLLDVQIDSFEWLIGSPRWREIAEAQEKARFDLETQKAAYDIARLELDYTRIVAPIGGVISVRMVKEGNLIQINQSLFRIDDFDPLLAVLNVPERELTTMRPGQTVSMHVDALPGVQFEGAVARVSPVVDAETGTFRVTTEFRDATQRLKSGMFGRVDVVYDQRADALVVPREALIEGDAEAAVFVLEPAPAEKPDAKKQGIETQKALADLIKAADEIAGIVKHTGRKKPTVIT